MNPGQAEVHHVVGGLLRRNGRILLCHRAASRRWYSNCWDLPGGHAEAGEGPERALARELAEELGIEVPSLGDPFAWLHGGDFLLHVWLIDQWWGEPATLLSIHDIATIEDFVDAHLLAPVPAAPDWRINFVAPLVTPSGRRIARGARFAFLRELLAVVGANASASLTTHYVVGHVAAPTSSSFP